MTGAAGTEHRYRWRVIASTRLRQKPERFFMESEMRELFGMILGCVLTIGFVYVHDMRATSTVANGTTALENRQIVNWDVAQANWNRMTENARHALIKIRDSVKDVTT